MDNKIVGERIIKLRKERNISQKKLAELISLHKKCSVSSVKMYEKGERMPRDDKKIIIANIFNVPIEQIFFNQQVTKSDNKNLRKENKQ